MLLEEPRIERVRHELKARIAEVVEACPLTPLMRRVVLRSPDFADLVSQGFDDHVRLFMPNPATGVVPLPEFTPDGPVFPTPGVVPESREYTLRQVDPGSNTVTIDFVLHGDGPAATWAASARPGDRIGVAGPRGSMVVKGTFDWHLFVGDETALPAIGRRIEELPASTTTIARIEINDANERQAFDSGASLDLAWIERNGAAPGSADLLMQALEDTAIPSGLGYAFVAAEANTVKRIRQYLVERRGLNQTWIKAPAYWRRDAAGYDDGHEH